MTGNTLSMLIYCRAPAAVRILADNLAEGLDGNMDQDLRRRHLNIVKMSLYLLCQNMDLLESGKSMTVTASTGRVRKQLAI